jgi:CheY-like chemotaxis protein
VATVRSLEAVGADVHAFGSPLEALRWLDTQHPPLDLLVTDGVMPEMNGLELIEAVQARYPQRPCLLLSGYPTDTFSGEPEVPVPFLAKPCSSEALRAKLATLLRRDRGDPLDTGGT